MPAPTRVIKRGSRTGFLPAVSAAAIKRMNSEIREWKLPRQTSAGLNELALRYNATLRGWLNFMAISTSLPCDESSIILIAASSAGPAGNTANLRVVRGAAAAGCRRWLSDNLGCSSIGSPLEKSRYGRWAPYDMRVSRTVLRGALGEIPGVYSPASRHALTASAVTGHGNQRVCSDFKLNPRASTPTTFSRITVRHFLYLCTLRSHRSHCSDKPMQFYGVCNGRDKASLAISFFCRKGNTK